MSRLNIDDINHIRSRLYSKFDSTNFNYSYTSMYNDGVVVNLSRVSMYS